MSHDGRSINNLLLTIINLFFHTFKQNNLAGQKLSQYFTLQIYYLFC